MRPLSAYGFEAAVAAAAVAVLALVSRVSGPEGLIQALYLAGISLVSFGAGWLRPASALRSSILVQAPQPVVMAVYMGLTGAFSQPAGNSTGGAAVALTIFTGFCIFLIGWNLLCALVGAHARGGRARRAGTRTGGDAAA